MTSTLPVIDLQELLRAIRSGAQDELDSCVATVAHDISTAVHYCGFFYVSGFRIDNGILKNVLEAQRTFFALPDDIKKESAIDEHNRGYLASGMAKMHGAKEHDQKEVFFWGAELPDDHPLRVNNAPLSGPNNWPTQAPGFREAVLAYSEVIRSIGDALLQAIAISLGLKSTFFIPFYEDSLLRGQLIRYPETQGGKDAFGVAPHTDFGCLTLLLQTTPGLEVLTRHKEWISAPPIDDTLVINVGELLARWSDDRLPTNVHRVKNTSNAERFSIAMFHDPNPLASINPADMGRQNSSYKSVSAAEYIQGRNCGAFSHYGKVAAKD